MRQAAGVGDLVHRRAVGHYGVHHLDARLRAAAGAAGQAALLAKPIAAEGGTCMRKPLLKV